MKAWAIAEGENIVAIRISKKVADDLCRDIAARFDENEYRVIPVTVTVDEKEKGE